MAVRADLVAADVSSAPDVAAENWPQLLDLASRPDWPGYFGAPRYAAAAVGARRWDRLMEWYAGIAVTILEGTDPPSLPKRTDLADSSPINLQIDGAALAREEELRAEQQAWLTRRGG